MQRHPTRTNFLPGSTRISLSRQDKEFYLPQGTLFLELWCLFTVWSGSNVQWPVAWHGRPRGLEDLPSQQGKERWTPKCFILILVNIWFQEEETEMTKEFRKMFSPFDFTMDWLNKVDTLVVFVWTIALPMTWFEIRSSNLTPNIEISKSDR